MAAGKRCSSNNEEAFTPNVKLVGRDAAHSFRRLMTRPYKTDEYLEETVSMWIDSEHSMTQKIQNSFELQSIFSEEVIKAREEPHGNSIKSLRAAKHRFESLQAPLGRTLLHLPAFLATC